MTPFEVTVKHTFTDEAIRSLLVSAFEGGSNYWYMIERYDYAKWDAGAFTDPKGAFYNPEYLAGLHLYLIPFVPGCALIIKEQEGQEEDKPFRLDRQALQTGLEIMRDKYPRHWANLIAENDDCETADVYLQCCLFGEVMYG